MRRNFTLCLIFVPLFFALATPSTEIGYATYYTLASCAREGNRTGRTASGKPYNESALTCALRSRDFGRFFCVSNPATGQFVIVQHTDFGPGRRPASRGVIVDLTPTAFRALGAELRQGKIQVTIKEVPR